MVFPRLHLQTRLIVGKFTYGRKLRARGGLRTYVGEEKGEA
jgi:hypothetical protein